MVGEDDVVEPLILGGEQTLGEVAPVVVLGARVDAVVGDAVDVVGQEEFGAGLGHFGFQDMHVRHAPGVEVVGAFAGVAAAGDDGGAAGGDEGAVGGAQAGAGDHVVQGCFDLGAGEAHVHPAGLHRVFEPVEIVGEAEEAALPDRHDVIGDVGMGEGPVSDADGGLGDGDNGAADPGRAVGEILAHAAI